MKQRLQQILTSLVLLPLLLVSLSLIRVQKTEAVSGGDWKAGRIIDDSIFFNKDAMSIGQIQAFLNAKVPVCAKNHSAYSAQYPPPYTCLKDYQENTSNGESNVGRYNGDGSPYQVPGGKSAAQIIWEEAQNYNINPQSLIVMLQKEQSLVTDDWPLIVQYQKAMGQSCPDTAPCDPAYAGFYRQVSGAAWQLRHYVNNPQYFNYRSGVTRYILYNPNSNCGGTNVFIENNATAALYNYTPYQPNQSALNNLYGSGDSCGAYGNRNFWRLFNDWFGSTLADSRDYMFMSSSATAVDYNPGGEGTVSISLKNTMGVSWYSDNNLPAGKQPTRLATIGYEDSPFADTSDPNWLGTRNQIVMTPNTVAPGEIATFTFKVSAPYRITSHQHRLVPILGGAFLRDSGMNVVLKSHIPAWDPLSSEVETTSLLPNQQAHAHFTVRNNSASKWYSDHNLPAGKQPARLATIGYENSPFADTSDPNWLGTRSQIMMTPDVVAPGETATFDAWFIGPLASTAQNKPFHFRLVVGGVFTEDKGLAFRFTTSAANLSFQKTASTNPPATMSPGQTVTVSYTLLNSGNTVWHDEVYQSGSHSMRLITSNPPYRVSAFYNLLDTAWLTPHQIKKPNGTTWPSQSETFTFTFKAPSTLGTYTESFRPSLGGTFFSEVPGAFTTQVQ